MPETPDQPPPPPQEQGISLRELSEAYAQSMGGQAAPDTQPEQGPAESVPAATDEWGISTPPGVPGESEAEQSDDDDPCQLCPRTILEAMLFMGNRENEPLTSIRAAELMRGVSPGEIAALVAELNHRYASNGRPYHIISEGAGYRISLRRAFYPVRNKFYGRVREARLSQAAVDVLAIVAYRQPITAQEVNRLRNTPSGHLLTQLVRRQLLQIDRPPGKSRPVSYLTTGRFLGLFGLESLDDLPQSEELEKT